MKPLIRSVVVSLFVALSAPAIGQNITPIPTKMSASSLATPKPTLKPKKVAVPVYSVEKVRLAAITETRAIFQDNDTEKYAKNQSIYYVLPGEKKLIDTGEDGVPGSVIAPRSGKYMVFLFDEGGAGRDINGDNTKQVVLRWHRFDPAYSLNLGVPARSATPPPGETTHQFEYKLEGDLLAFSLDEDGSNSTADKDAPWYVMNVNALLYAVEGTPTPTPSPKPVTPLPTATPTKAGTPVSGIRARSDINQDGWIDAQDLLIFQLDWRSPHPLAE